MKYNPALDGIRAIAIIMVLTRHAFLLPGGFLGVDVFFVLSGFLITSILLSEVRETGTISLRSFYVRRFMRLYPPMLCLIAAYLVMAPQFWPQAGNPVLHATVAATYMSDYAHLLSSQYYGKIGYLWSLAVEEKFYLIWPVLLMFILRSRRPLLLTGLLFVVATAWRFWLSADGAGWARVYFCFDARASGLMLGSFIALWLEKRPAPNVSFAGTAAALLLLACSILFQWRDHASLMLGIPLAELAAVALILQAQRADGWLASKPLVALGKYSYGLYLWHMPVMLLMRDSYGPTTTLLVGGGIGLACAMVSYHTVEAWFRNRRHLLRVQPAPVLQLRPAML